MNKYGSSNNLKQNILKIFYTICFYNFTIYFHELGIITKVAPFIVSRQSSDYLSSH